MKTRAEYATAYRKRHPERVRESRRLWRLRNPGAERVANNERTRLWRKENPEAAKAKDTTARNKHREARNRRARERYRNAKLQVARQHPSA